MSSIQTNETRSCWTLRCGTETDLVHLWPLFFAGHCYYVRKCIRGKPVNGDPTVRQIGGIVLPQAFWLTRRDERTGEECGSQNFDCMGRTNWVKVLAVGPAVGKRCTAWHAKKYQRPRHMSDNVKTGDLLLCPNQDIGIRISPISPVEAFIEEGLPFAVKKDNGHE